MWRAQRHLLFMEYLSDEGCIDKHHVQGTRGCYPNNSPFLCFLAGALTSPVSTLFPQPDNSSKWISVIPKHDTDRVLEPFLIEFVPFCHMISLIAVGRPSAP